MIHRLITFCLILGIAMLSGCSDAVQLRGTVTFEDGSPVGIGTVCFDSGSSIARGDLQSDGTYRLSTVNPCDGMPPGSFKKVRNHFSLCWPNTAISAMQSAPQMTA